MDAPTCPVCGCLIGDQDTHRDWHAKSSPAAPAVEQPATDPDARKAPDPAPYSA
jgi:hypothetical protein